MGAQMSLRTTFQPAAARLRGFVVLDNVERGALLGTRFRHDEGGVRKVEGEQADLA